MNPVPGSEKRKFYRHPVSVPIEYHEKQVRAGHSATVDISEGGISFLAERFIAKGSAINLKIPVGDQMFAIEGQVAYSNRVPTLNRFKTGVAFTNPSHAFRAKLVEEMVQINLFREKLSREENRAITEEEASQRWVEKYAKRFGELFN